MLPSILLAQHPDAEWTFEQAQKCWTPMKRPVEFLGVPGHQFQMAVFWDGSIVSGYLAIQNPPVFRKEMEYLGNRPVHMIIGFGPKMNIIDHFGSNNPKIRRYLEQGRLPIVHTITEDNGLQWHQTTFAHILERKLQLGQYPLPEEMLIAHSIFTVTNKSLTPQTANLWLYLTHPNLDFGYKVRIDPNLGIPSDYHFKSPFGIINDKVRFAIPRPDAGSLIWHDLVKDVTGARGSAGSVIQWQVSLAPGQSASLRFLLPNGLISPEKADKMIKLDSDAVLREVIDFWQKIIYGPGQIATPDPFFNDYLAAVAANMAQQTAFHEKGNIWMSKTSPIHYEYYWPCIAGKAVTTLEMRGLEYLAVPVLQSFADFANEDAGELTSTQWPKKPIPGEGFEKRPVFLGNFGTWTANTMLMSHGLELAALADHYRLTRDDKWLNAGNPSHLQIMLDAFDWVAAQRRRTMRKENDVNVPHWGLLPAASAHDWLSGNAIFNDAWCIYGMTELVHMLKETKHQRADEMAKELNDYRACLHQRYLEARDKARPLPLPDGTTIPFVPRVVQELDWSKIDWTITGYGPLRTGAVGAFDPCDQLVNQALAFLEAGLPKGQSFYFSFQSDADRNFADISDPSADRHYLWRHYVEYETMWPMYDIFLKRDDLSRFFECLFNNFAVAIHRDFRAGVESLDGTPWCGPGDAERWRAVRNMFVNEFGGYDGSQQSLWLLQAIPHCWLRPGCKTLSVKEMATFFGGPVDIEAAVADNGDSINVKCRLNLVVCPKEIRMRLRSGDGRPLVRAEINGKKTPVLKGDIIVLPQKPKAKYTIVGYF